MNLNSVKFLGVYLDPKLTWEHHAEHLSNTISKNTYPICSLTNLVSREVLISAYYGNIHSHLLYAILCWGHSPRAARVFAVQRRCMRIMAGLGYRECCRASFVSWGILTLPSIYILACLMRIKDNEANYAQNCYYHDYHTRTRNNFVLNYSRTARSRDGRNHYGLKFFNALPNNIKYLEPFKHKIQSYLKLKAFYNLDEFLNNNFEDLF